MLRGKEGHCTLWPLAPTVPHMSVTRRQAEKEKIPDVYYVLKWQEKCRERGCGGSRDDRRNPLFLFSVFIAQGKEHFSPWARQWMIYLALIFPQTGSYHPKGSVADFPMTFISRKSRPHNFYWLLLFATRSALIIINEEWCGLVFEDCLEALLQ